MMARIYRVTMALLLVTMVAALGPSPGFAQGSATSSISGTVTDSTGGVVPGADVTAKNNATGVLLNAVSGSNGSFTIPAVSSGTYTVTVKLMGFKTTVLNEVIVTVAGPATIKAVLEIGGLEETVIVAGATEVIQTQATSVAMTLNSRQIANLPVGSRAAFNLIATMPGVNSSTGSVRDGSVNGLPQSAVNITLDGMNIQDNYAKTWDGMFTRVSPRIDAVEEVTVSTAALGADMGGQGAVQMKFVTRSGTNRFDASAYFYYRREWMDTNTWWNLHRNVDALTGKVTARSKVFQNQPGGRLGGPIIKDKAFFFVNFEIISSPGSRTDTRTIMSPLSEQGIFQYAGGAPVDLMALAAKNNREAKIDPVVLKLLADVRASTSKGIVTSTVDPLTQSFSWVQNTKSRTIYPTVRLDYNLTSKHRLSLSGTFNGLISNPDTTNSGQAVFPGFPVHGLQDSIRYAGTLQVRSTLTKSMVNELRVGATGGRTLFSPDINAGLFGGQSVADQGGYAIGWSGFKSISNPYTTSTFSAREGSTRVIEDTASLLVGRHSLSIGASATRGDVWLDNKQHVPTITLGMVAGDPADAMFNPANFPGASGTDTTNAKNLYAILTGRVASIGRNARIGEDGAKYNILGLSHATGRMWQLGFFVQDGWRWKPNLTINAGLRYEVQLPFYSLNNSYSQATVADVFGPTGTGSGFVVGSAGSNLGNLFKPNVLQGTPTTYEMLAKNSQAYNTDLNNLGPSIGAAWTTGARSGVLHTIFGPPGDTVVRFGYNVAYQRQGMSDYTDAFGNNPGISIDATRNLTNGNLGTLPVLLTGGDLSAPAIVLDRVYPMAVPSASSNVRAFDPNIQIPWAGSGTIGIQRALSKSMSVEVRYIRTDSHQRWTAGDIGNLNYNEIDVVDNGFVNEFRIAQANLAANTLAGLAGTKGFAYTGAAGTNPLPIFLANINGSNAPGDTTKYTGTGWTTTTLVQSMYALNPNVFTAASNLRTNATYKANMAAAGLPINFWVVNPDVSGAYIVSNGPSQTYNGIQFILNRRFSKGFQLTGNYTYGKGYQKDLFSLRKPYVERIQTYTNSSAASGNINHVAVMSWVYELPFGRNKALAGNVGPILNRVIGNWSFMGVARYQTGRLVDFGNVNLVGFTPKELEKMFKLRMTTDPTNGYRTLVWMLPQDVIDNTVKAYSLTATGYSAGDPTGRYFKPAGGPGCMETVSQGYGDCGLRSVIVQGPPVIKVDVTIAKRIALVKTGYIEFQVQVFNVFNRVNYNPVTGIGSTVDSYQVTGAVDSSRTGQLSLRIGW